MNAHEPDMYNMKRNDSAFIKSLNGFEMETLNENVLFLIHFMISKFV